MMKENTSCNYKTYCLLCLTFLFLTNGLSGQTLSSSNISAKAFVLDENTIRVRWAPANTKSWVEGKKYGYTVERYTVMTDNLLQDDPLKKTIASDFKPKPLNEWKDLVEKSDYAAVIAQAFYGEDFELNTSDSDIGSIINQASELEQRFSTSLFVADLDYKAAEMAGWAWTDNEIRSNEKYVYRIYLNRPEAQEGDTAAIFISVEDYMELPQPVGLTALFGDRSVLLSWNYIFQSTIYPAYHIERKSSNDTIFQRITDVPVTVLGGEMNEIYYTDSLANNDEDYSYRVVGVTCFDKEGPVSDTVTGRGQKIVACVPRITSGDFISDDYARILWEFDCPETEFVQKLQLVRSETASGQFHILVDSIHVFEREQTIPLIENRNYLKLLAVHKDSTIQESFPFLVQKIDSIPPAIPTGLKVTIDSTGIAHLTWTMNVESDLRGYRILRSFTPEEEMTSISADFVAGCEFHDSLSLALGNKKIYYSLTALDIRYNESSPCEVVAVDKPNRQTPDEPVILDYQLLDNRVKINWITDKNRDDVYYSLLRYSMEDLSKCDTVYKGDHQTTSFTDEPVASGRYQYAVVATDLNGRKSISPQRITIEIRIHEELNTIANFSYYIDRERGYIELSWKKNEKARIYRIYRSEEDAPMELWKETENANNRIVDETVSPNTTYTYTILFLTNENRMSKPKTLSINY
ncbi:MAG: hypothetical protein LBL58_10815 [Tannerellaceae bacterium]|jgi:fibronectin type 3 domain-containing protein|nr:hypothetical protein [Tannerellaceae bacterium]